GNLWLESTYNHILAALFTPSALVEHAEGFADSGCISEKDFEAASRGEVFVVGHSPAIVPEEGLRRISEVARQRPIVSHKSRRPLRKGPASRLLASSYCAAASTFRAGVTTVSRRNGIPVRAGFRMSEEGANALIQLGTDDVLEFAGLRMHLVFVYSESVLEKALG